jgi:hypothetical protein
MKDITKDQAYCSVDTHGTDALYMLNTAINLILDDSNLHSRDKVANAGASHYSYEELIGTLICAEARIKEQADEIRQYQEIVREN